MPNSRRHFPWADLALIQMTRLAWEAHPVAFLAIIFLNVLQGALPVGSAWLTKLLFDLLSQGLQGVGGASLSRELVLILCAQAALLVISQVANSMDGYLNAEMGRNLTVKLQSTIYRKVSSFIGIAYFENPQFHDALRLGNEGAFRGAA